MFLVVLLYALFASVFTIEKVNLQYAQPLFLVGSRMFAAGFLMLIYLLIFYRKDLKIQKQHIWKILCLAVFNIYLTNIFELIALKHLNSYKTCFIYNLSPFVSVLLSYLVFSERIAWKKWIGLIIGFVGFIPLLIEKNMNVELTQGASLVSWPEILMLLAVFSSVYGWIVLKQLVNTEGYSSLSMNGISMFVGGLMALIHSYFAEDWNPIPVTEFIPFLECCMMLLIISNLICYNLYGILLRRFSATFMSFAGFSTPMFTAFFGWLFLGEVITFPFYLSATIVFIGLLIFSQEELKGSYVAADNVAV